MQKIELILNESFIVVCKTKDGKELAHFKMSLSNISLSEHERMKVIFDVDKPNIYELLKDNKIHS